MPIGLTHLYYICFLSGIAISASVFIALHYLFPAEQVKEFVDSAPSPAILQVEYRERWDAEAEDVERIQEHTKP